MRCHDAGGQTEGWTANPLSLSLSLSHTLSRSSQDAACSLDVPDEFQPRAEMQLNATSWQYSSRLQSRPCVLAMSACAVRNARSECALAGLLGGIMAAERERTG